MAGKTEQETALEEGSADRLRAFRARHGDASQARAAKWIRTPVRTWEGWENEHREPPPCLWVLLDYIDRYGLLADSSPAS